MVESTGACILICTAASPPCRFLFRWVTTRAVSVWHSCTWTIHHTPGTSLRGCRSFVLGIYRTVQCSHVKLSTTYQDMTAAVDTHVVCMNQLVQDDWWHHDFFVHSPKTKLSGLNNCPNGPERTESMVPGSRSTRMARGTNLLPLDGKKSRG